MPPRRNQGAPAAAAPAPAPAPAPPVPPANPLFRDGVTVIPFKIKYTLPKPLPDEPRNKERERFINSRVMPKVYHSVLSNISLDISRSSEYVQKVPLEPEGEEEKAQAEQVNTKRDWKLQFLPMAEGPKVSHKYRYPVTPRHGHFIVELQPPTHLARDGYLPIKVLFLRRNLYVLGFLHNNIWCLTNDVNVAHNDMQWVHHLPFEGGYGIGGLEHDYAKVKLGSEGILDTYMALSHYDPAHQNTAQVRLALKTLVGNISEPSRFLALQRRAMKAFKEQETMMVDAAATDNNNVEQGVPGQPNAPTAQGAMSANFTSWRTFCNYVRGKAKFVHAPGYPAIGVHCLEDVFSAIGIMLRPSDA